MTPEQIAARENLELALANDPRTATPLEASEAFMTLTTMYSHRGDGIPTQYVHSAEVANAAQVMWKALLTALRASQPVPASGDLVERVFQEAMGRVRMDKVFAAGRANFLKDVTGSGIDEHLFKETVRQTIRAIIPIIQAEEREECAKVGDRIAQQRRNWQRGNFGNSTGLDEANGAGMVATAIRERNGG